MKRAALLLCLLATVPALATTTAEVNGQDAIVAPQCATPASLGFTARPAAGWIVIFADEADPDAKTAAVEARHGFKADEVYPFGGFYVEKLSPARLAALRCESTVAVIEQNGQPRMR